MYLNFLIQKSHLLEKLKDSEIPSNAKLPVSIHRNNIYHTVIFV